MLFRSLISNKEYQYKHAVNTGATLYDVGLTATDDGIIQFDKNTITVDEYIKLLSDSQYTFVENDNRLYLLPVSGNTKNYIYPCEYVDDGNEKYYSFNGGFLQGVYKGYGYNYQVLPQYIQDAFQMEFVIRPKSDYIESGNTINIKNNDKNKGIFFYIGTRSENKFVQFYNYDLSVFNTRENVDEISSEEKNRNIESSEGNPVLNNEYTNIYTDNGYLIYDRTCKGYTIRTWNKENVLKIIHKYREYDTNLYLLLDRTCHGYTVKTLPEYQNSLKHAKEIVKDLTNNAFALKVTNDGRVGYKYLVRDCDNELQYGIKEEYTFPNIVKNNEWNVINVVFKIMTGATDDCGKPLGERKMKIYIYVNGYLKLVSQELPELNIRELTESYEKQELVPFNISLGGGTQGLSESTWINSYEGFPYILPIEEHFSGTFIGDIRSFKFYNCQLQYNQIKNNYIYETTNV